MKYVKATGQNFGFVSVLVSVLTSQVWAGYGCMQIKSQFGEWKRQNAQCSLRTHQLLSVIVLYLKFISFVQMHIHVFVYRDQSSLNTILESQVADQIVNNGMEDQVLAQISAG